MARESCLTGLRLDPNRRFDAADDERAAERDAALNLAGALAKCNAGRAAMVKAVTEAGQ